MPYVIVNKKNIQYRDVIVAASNWVESMSNGKSFVYLPPKAKCDKVKELLVNEIAPSKGWEKHECDVLIRNIPTLGSAYKAIEMVRRRGFKLREDSLDPQYGLAVAEKRLKIDAAGDAHTKEIPVTIYESLTNDDDGQDMFLFSDADNVKEDPFSDVVPPLEQPLPILSCALPTKPPAVVVEQTKPKPNEGVQCMNLLMQADKDPLGDIATPTLPIPKPTNVNVSDRMQPKNKPTPVAAVPKPIIVHVPDQVQITNTPTPLAAVPKPIIVNVPEQVQITNTPTPLAAVPKPIIVNVPEQVITSNTKMPPIPVEPLPQIPKHLSVVVHNNPPVKMITGKVISGSFVTNQVITGNVISGNATTCNVTSGKATGNVAHPNEPLEKDDNQQSPQLQNLLFELKSMIISNQAEIKRQVCEGFKQMQHSFMLLLEQQKWEAGCQNPECVEKNRFRLDVLRTIEDVKRFEERLKDTEYRTKLRSWLFVKLKMEQDGWKRMDTMFLLMFDKALHTQLNWSGLFGKEALQSYVNITQLFEFIATTPTHQANMIEVATFFKQKVGYFPQENKTVTFAASTKAKEPIVKPATVIDAANNNNNNNSNALATGGKKEGEHLSETDSMTDTSDVECATEQDVSMESRDEGSNQSSTDNPSTSTGGSSRKSGNTFITSMDKMDRFEKQLSDKKVQQQVHKWVDKTFGREPDVDKRLNLLLNRLIDMKVFQHFKWKSPACGMRLLVEYPNFIELFEFASRTVEGDKTVINTELVANFFKKRLTYVQQRKVQYKLAKTNDHTFKIAGKKKSWLDLV